MSNQFISKAIAMENKLTQTFNLIIIFLCVVFRAILCNDLLTVHRSTCWEIFCSFLPW